MKSIIKTTGIFMVAAAVLALSGTAGFAQIAPQEAEVKADLIMLTPNHGRSINFSLESSVGGAGGLHTTFLLTTGAGNLQINIANATPLKKDSELIFFVAGFINTTPFFEYAYASGGTASIRASGLPDFSFGMLFTGVLYKTSGIDYPVTMSLWANFTSLTP